MMFMGMLLVETASSECSADEVDVYYMTTTTTAGKSFITKLDGSYRLPMVNAAERTIKVNYRTHSIDDIESIRFEKRTETIDAITDIDADTDSGVRSNRVFTLGGQCVDADDMGRLSKGIYIINNRKVVVK